MNIEDWSQDYYYDPVKNDYIHKTEKPIEKTLVSNWFTT